MDYNGVEQVVAIFSIIFSGFVLLSFILFEELRKRLFMQIIAFISFADIIGNVPYITSDRPKTGTWWCQTQGFFNLYAYPVSWMWTTVLVYFLYCITIDGKLPFSELKTHILCWGLPLVFTLLVLTTNNYGRLTDDDEYLCIYGGDRRIGYIWHMITYYGLFFSCALFMIFCSARIHYRLQEQESSVDINKIKEIIISMKLYPWALLILWTPHVIANFLEPFFTRASLVDFFLVGNVMKILHGMVTACIFFYKSKSTRNKWISFFLCGSVTGIQFRESTESKIGDEMVVEYATNPIFSRSSTINTVNLSRESEDEASAVEFT